MSGQLKVDKQAVDPPKLKRLVVSLGSLACTLDFIIGFAV